MEHILSLGFLASAVTNSNTGCEQFCSRAFRHRDRIATAGTALASIALLLTLQFFTLAPAEPEPAPITIELVEIPQPKIEPEPVPEKPLPPPKAVVLPKPQAPQPTPQVKPAPAMAEPAPALPVQPQPLPKPVEPPKAVEPPAPPQQPRSNPAAESGYQARARADIDKQKRYPDEAQQLGMTGSVVVSYAIARDGHLLHAEIAQSSGFKLLDQAALQAVQRTRFTAMPADAWIGTTEQSFRTRIAFTLD
ncbi:MAG: energy transducer TonB [Sulfurimicrobium sp.]|nr:energy transducer TonB [Sulfurimicrobium sp.]MDP2200052.1 energy transducer TonB [Sulfurimicrobium sp.]MDP3686110.1 energy transducer TonB [Sulfurimicrobium sp.]MDZ7656170.1 energy transducer TonB [Sulfurimicrobium sp.]